MEKHRRIARELRSEIAAGLYGKEGKLPSEAQLVARFHVSRPTVARALNDLQQEGLIHRRAGSGSFLREPTTAADGPLLGLLVPGRGSTEVLDLICGEIGALARLRGFGLLWGRSAHPLQDRTLDAEVAEEACTEFVKRSVRGVIFAPFEHLQNSEAVNRRLLDLLRQAGIPVVLLDRDFTRYPLRSDYDLVGLDNVQAGFLAAEHLLRLGCRHVRFLSEPGSASTINARVAGVREAMLARGVPPPKALHIEGDPSDERFVRSQLLKGKPEALVCGNDYTAARLVKSLLAIKVSVPKQIRIVGYDDVRYATLAPIPLTTVRQPCRELAAVAFHTLEERIRETAAPPRTLLLTPTLVVRESCGAYRQPANARR